MNRTIGISVLAVLLLAAPALADPTTVPLSAAGLNDLYVDGDGTAWEESNGLAGLQREATTLEDGSVVPADTQLGA